MTLERSFIFGLSPIILSLFSVLFSDNIKFSRSSSKIKFIFLII